MNTKVKAETRGRPVTHGLGGLGRSATGGGAGGDAVVPRVEGSMIWRRCIAVLAYCLPLLTTVGLLLLWELLAQTGVFSSDIPSLWEIGDWLSGAIATSRLWNAIGQTMIHWAGGVALGSVVGIGIGLLLATIPLLERLLIVPLEFLRPIPSIVYLPIMLLLLGAKSSVVVILVAVVVLWPMMFQTLYGFRSIETTTRDTGKVFGLGRRQMFAYIVAPSILPYIATGVRISSALALVVAVGIELLGGIAGLGAELALYSSNGVFPAMYGTIFVAGVLGLLLNVVFERLERLVLHWHTSQRTVDAGA
jgi:ABC-type nitrate/sulfonate/bicarbonate transport system permease component